MVDPLSLATVTRSVLLPDGTTFELEHPRSLAEGVIDRTVIPAVLAAVRGVHSAVAAAQYAVVTTYRDNQLRIAYHGARSRFIREDIIPVLAASDAHQWGRNQVRGRMYDSDIEAAALAEMQARLDRRWTY